MVLKYIFYKGGSKVELMNNNIIEDFLKGQNFHAYEYFGCHEIDGSYVFRVWAPHAKEVYLIGDFCKWDTNEARPMEKIHDEGIFEIWASDFSAYEVYKYFIINRNGTKHYKADPFASHAETRPSTGSKVYTLPTYSWHDDEWLEKRKFQNLNHSPVNAYELHMGSWRTYPDGSPFDYRVLAKELTVYIKEMGYTHVEFMAISEYPYDKSWGYQVTGYFAPTSRYGTPEDFMYLVDELHKEGIGVLLDWVPAHFPRDAHGLFRFDGEPCYEYSDIRKGEHPDWGTVIFDYGKGAVQSFLISSALNWVLNYHIDGLRVDAVASMLYLDYGRKAGEWVPNIHGGKENLEAISFLRKLNGAIKQENTGAIMVAEESTAFPRVTAPISDGGLGFDFKWNMGWMHDTISYMKTDSLFRRGVHNQLTFSLTYAFSEHYVLALSHDEVVHGKGSLIDKMSGEYEIKFANLRSYMAYMFAHPGKKLTFMGSEFAHFAEWSEEKELDWFLLEYDMHRMYLKFSRSLNWLYKDTPALWQCDDSFNGFDWISGDDKDQNVISFIRYDKEGNGLIVISHFSSPTLDDYCIGVPYQGDYQEIFSTNDEEFGGEGIKNGICHSKKIPLHGKDYSLSLTLPPYSTIYFYKRAPSPEEKMEIEARKALKKRGKDI